MFISLLSSHLLHLSSSILPWLFLLFLHLSLALPAFPLSSSVFLTHFSLSSSLYSSLCHLSYFPSLPFCSPSHILTPLLLLPPPRFCPTLSSPLCTLAPTPLHPSPLPVARCCGYEEGGSDSEMCQSAENKAVRLSDSSQQVGGRPADSRTDRMTKCLAPGESCTPPCGSGFS